MASEWEKWKKRFQYHIAVAGLSDNKQKRAVLLQLIGNFETLSNTGDDYESPIASLDSYFIRKKNLVYKRYNFLSTRQNSAETIKVYLTRQ